MWHILGKHAKIWLFCLKNDGWGSIFWKKIVLLRLRLLKSSFGTNLRQIL